MFGGRGEDSEQLRRDVAQTRDELLAAVERLNSIVARLETATEITEEGMGQQP